VQALAAGLLMTIWWIPPEAAVDGDTSWRAIAWLLLAVLWSLHLSLSRVACGVSHNRWNGFDVSVALIVGGHVVGGCLVLLTTGQKRTSANLLVEWLGLAAAWWVLRGLAGDQRFRDSVTRMMLAAAITAAGLGVWQHEIALPALARDYGPRIAEARRVLAQGQSSPVVRELAAAGIPTTEPGLTLFEQRLLASREPFGMFGLANTLAGLLASAGLWLLSSMSGRNFALNSRRGITAASGLVLIGWCLVLTKSRSALLGLVVGLGFWGLTWLAKRGTWRLTTRQSLYLAGAASSIAALPMLLVSTGAWDWQVLAEAPKSLIYRWQYWVASLQLIRESPWLGVGLGQFRQQYLRVKLPAASEEIADPHNLWCDAWLNGGVLSIIGLLIGLGCALKMLSRSAQKPLAGPASYQGNHEKSRSTPNNSAAVAVVGGSLLATPVLLLVQAALGAWDDRLLCASLAIATIYGLLWHQRSEDDESTANPGSFGLALIPLVIHLHGAGGFEMPGVLLWCEMLLSFSIAVNTPDRQSATVETRGAFPWRPMSSAGLALLTAATLWGLWWPGLRCRSLLDQADALFSRNPAAAVPLWKQAAVADPWNPEPWNRLAELSRQAVPGLPADLKNSSSTLEQIDQVDHDWQAAQTRDPLNPQGWEHRAETAELRYSRSHEPEDLARAVNFWTHAVAGYPTNSLYLARLAAVAEQQGDRELAISSAKKALQQDDLNQQLGHRERWLPAETRHKLEALLQIPTTDHSPRNRVVEPGKSVRTVVIEAVNGLH